MARPRGATRAGAPEEVRIHRVVRAITLEELADESEASPELVRRFVELGEIRPLADGRFDARDAAILTTVRSLLGAGIELDDLAWAISTGRFGLGVVGRLFTDPSPRGETYAELSASLRRLMMPWNACIQISDSRKRTSGAADSVQKSRFKAWPLRESRVLSSKPVGLQSG